MVEHASLFSSTAIELMRPPWFTCTQTCMFWHYYNGQILFGTDEVTFLAFNFKRAALLSLLNLFC